METDKTNITSDLLDNLEKLIELTDLSTNEDFLNVLKLDRAIIYMLVDWSGPERVSRLNVYKAFKELNNKEMSLFKINCSDQTKDYVIDRLIKQRENQQDLYYGGWGETLLINKGNIVDFIKNPGQLGQQQTKLKLLEWGQYCR